MVQWKGLLHYYINFKEDLHHKTFRVSKRSCVKPSMQFNAIIFVESFLSTNKLREWRKITEFLVNRNKTKPETCAMISLSSDDRVILTRQKNLMAESQPISSSAVNIVKQTAICWSPNMAFELSVISAWIVWVYISGSPSIIKQLYFYQQILNVVYKLHNLVQASLS